MQPCTICGCTEFNIEAGYFFCQECQTQTQEAREEVLDLNIDSKTRLRKVKIRRKKFEESVNEVRWTSWEQYNFILIGLANELIELGATADIKLTILQLWATYLGKIEIAFTSTKKQCVPKLARRFHKKDAEIIYGKSELRKRKRKRNSSSSGTSITSGQQSEVGSTRELNRQKRLMITAEYDRYIQSQNSLRDDAVSSMNQSLCYTESNVSCSTIRSNKLKFSNHANEEAKKVKSMSKNVPLKKRTKYQLKHVTSNYKKGPYIITPMRLWALLYLALRIHNQDIHLADMLRYGREGHLSYYKLHHLLPPEITLTRSDINILTPNQEITHIGMRHMSANIAKFLNVWEIDCPNFLPLISRYCYELQLPRCILSYTERLIALSPPKMSFSNKDPLIPNYEGRAMAFIIVVLKLLFGMDGITEYDISRTAEKVNSKSSNRGILESKFFSFREWQRYIECRKIILANAHFPSKLKHDLDLPETNHLYLHFLRYIQSKKEGEEPEATNYYKLIPREVANAMKHYISKLNENSTPLKEVEIFAPSLTPQYSYLAELLKHPLHDLPNILQTNFVETQVNYMTKSEHIQKLAARCKVKLEVVDSNLHFIEKMVPPFEVSRMPTKEELNQQVRVEDCADQRTESDILENEDVTECLYRKNTSKLRLNVIKQSHYDAIQNSIRNSKNTVSECFNDFAFNDVLPSGKLLIPDDSDSKTKADHKIHKDNKDNLACEVGNNDNSSVLQQEFYEKYNLTFSNREKKAILCPEEIVNTIYDFKSRAKPLRNSKGKFIKKRAAKYLQCTESGFYSEKSFRKQSKSNIKTIRDAEISTLQNDADGFTLKNDVSKNLSFELRSNLKEQWGKNEANVENCSNSESMSSITSITSNKNVRSISQSSSDLFNLNDDEISILQDNSFDKTNNDVFAASSNDKCHAEGTFNDIDQLFKPYKEYWMYHCIFGSITAKHFEHFEKELPVSFRWLLNECANVVEMTKEDLYTEVCLIEKYHKLPLKPSNLKQNNKDFVSRKRFNTKNKW